MVRNFIEICNEIGFPVSKEKTEWASTVVIFLGVVLNGEKLCLAIPQDKLVQALNMVSKMRDSKKTTVKAIQRLAGTLNFLNKVIVPGRPFMRRMYMKYADIANKDVCRLKPYHHVAVDTEFRSDCNTWRLFLMNQASFSRPIVDFEDSIIDSKDVGFYTDVSLAELKGFGCIFGPKFTWGIWEPNFIRECKPSIAYAELYALCIGIFTWQEHLSNIKMIAYCDNKSVRDMVNSMASGCKNCMYLIRLLTLNNLIHNRKIKVIYVESKNNAKSDALSRGKISKYLRLA